MGVDFSVGGRVGVPYYAVEDGYIWRVRVSPYGYGKVVYVKLQNGYTAIYAHLSRCTERIEQIIHEEQLRQQAYTVDLYFNSRQFPVRQGAVVAYSGKSGIGVPHMHFELRDQNNAPINPFSHGLRFRDTVSPSFTAVAFVPLDAQARVNGYTHPVIQRLVRRNGGWELSEEPVLYGRVGVAIAAVDRTQNGRYRLGLHTSTISLDGEEIFRRTYERVTFPEQHMEVFDRNYHLLLDSRGKFHNMYKVRGNRLPFYGNATEGAGVLACACSTRWEGETFVANGRHELLLHGEDFSGNTATAHVRFLAGRAPEFISITPVQNDSGFGLAITAADCTDFVSVSAWTSSDEGRTWDILAVETNTDSLSHRIHAAIQLPHDTLLVRLTANDTLGLTSQTTLRPKDLYNPPQVEITENWGRNWCELEITTSRPLSRLPRLEASWSTEFQVPVNTRELQPGFYEADIVPEESWPREYRLRVFSGPGRPTIVSCWQESHAIQGSVELMEVHQDGSATYRGTVEFQEEFPDSGAIHLVADQFDTTLIVRGGIIGREGGSYRNESLGAVVEAGRSIVPEPMLIRVAEDTLLPQRELEPVGHAWVFEPQLVPFAGSASLSVTLPDTTDLTGIALYTVFPSGAKHLATPEETVDHTLRARVKTLCTVGAFRDLTPPRIRFRRPRSGSSSRNRTPRISVSVRDDGAGFARSDNAMEMLVDGSWVPAEYDPEDNTLIYTPREPLSAGNHTIVVNARDQVGNEATASLRFTIR